MYYSYKAKPKFYYSYKEIDFSNEYFDYEQFLLQEFFTSDSETKKQFLKQYEKIYGCNALIYFNKKYSEWRESTFSLSNEMKNRILSIMPEFLSENAVHKLGMYEFVFAIKDIINNFQVKQKNLYATKNLDIKDIASIFQNEYKRILNIESPSFRFNLLSDAEKKETVEIAKYILKYKLQKKFYQIERDFKTFTPYLSKLKNVAFWAHYTISAFGVKIPMTKNTFLNDMKIPRFEIKTITANADNKYKEYVDKYLAYELVMLRKDVVKAACNSFLNDYDFNFLMDSLITGKMIKVESTFQGEGGLLNIRIRTLTFVYIRYIRILFYIAAIFTIIYLYINFPKHIVPYTILIIPIVILLIINIAWKIEQIYKGDYI
jgi:hypothetical protein